MRYTYRQKKGIHTESSSWVIELKACSNILSNLKGLSILAEVNELEEKYKLFLARYKDQLIIDKFDPIMSTNSNFQTFK